MCREAEMSFSGTSTVVSVHQGAAEAPRGAGARAAGEEDEVVSRLATIFGPAAQEEARGRALHRAQLMAALKEKTAGIPGASVLWAKLEVIEQVSSVAPPIPRSSWALSRS